MAQLEHIEGIEKRLWSAADTLRSNSNYASNEYFLPVMGLIFLRHAYSRFLKVKEEVEANLPTRGGKIRELKKEDFSQKSAIFLKPEAQFDYLVSLSDGAKRADAIFEAMDSIEKDYDSLNGVLPKSEYKNLDDEVLGQLIGQLNPEVLKQVSGDVFGRIYEYFLTKFADLKAHDGGEFFTPISLVSLIANIIEPDRGIVFDPACGSGGMFVQSARLLEQRHDNPQKLTFRGLEKNPTTIRLAKMNLAVHGLEGDIQQAITYYEDPFTLVGKADFVMANPPFNVDEVDDKVEGDARLPFGLPGVNKNKKVSNGNYLWISYFYSYLNQRGRSGFVMSSQASSAGGDQAKVRQKLIETGDVELMIAIRSNFFYTRSVPCELWFLNRAKSPQMREKILMIDARQIYRKVTRKIYDFSPEQLQNIVSIVWLYRGESARFLDLVQGYLAQMLEEGNTCVKVLADYQGAISNLQEKVEPFLKEEFKNNRELDNEIWAEFWQTCKTFQVDGEAFTDKLLNYLKPPEATATALNEFIEKVQPLAETSRDLVKQADLVYKLAVRLVDYSDKNLGAKESSLWVNKDVKACLKNLDIFRQSAVEQLKQVRYFWRQAQWLMVRFSDAQLRDVEGLVKLVNSQDLAATDWSLTPGRYVGVTPEEVDENFDFEESLRDIHIELKGLNEEAIDLAKAIEKNFEELGI
jgi:type I restriction enzyme M protein